MLDYILDGHLTWSSNTNMRSDMIDVLHNVEIIGWIFVAISLGLSIYHAIMYYRCKSKK